MKSLISIGLFITTLLLIPGRADAGTCGVTSCSLTFDALNDPSGTNNPPYNFGTITLTLITSGIHTGDIEIKVDVGPSTIITAGTHEAFTFNSDTTAPLTITGLNSEYSFVNASNTPAGSPGSYTNPGFNSAFMFAIQCNKSGGGGCDQTSIDFFVHRATAFTSVASLIQASGSNPGVYFTADVLLNGTGPTTPIGATTVDNTIIINSTPEPGSVVLLSSGLLGLGLLARRKRTS